MMINCQDILLQTKNNENSIKENEKDFSERYHQPEEKDFSTESENSLLKSKIEDLEKKNFEVLGQFSELKNLIESQSYLIGPSEKNEMFFEDIRNAIKKRKRIKIKYCDKKDSYSSRVIWPIGLVYMESCWLLVAWCEMRNDFRHFRTDKIEEMVQLDSIYSESRTVLLKKWRVKEGICMGKEY